MYIGRNEPQLITSMFEPEHIVEANKTIDHLPDARKKVAPPPSIRSVSPEPTHDYTPWSPVIRSVRYAGSWR